MKKFVLTPVAIALTAALSTSLTRPATATPAMAPSIVACLSNPYCFIGIAIVGGVVYWELQQNGKTQWIPLAPILDNPDAQSEEWTDYVWADDLVQAKRKCQGLAQGWKIQFLKVRKVGNGKKFECTFRG